MLKANTDRPRPAQSLSATLTVAFLTLSVVMLLASGGLQLFFNIQAQQEAVANKQQLIAQDAAKTVSNFIEEKFSTMQTTVRLVTTGEVPLAEQPQVLESMLSLQPSFRHLVLLDAQDKQTIYASRISGIASEKFITQITTDLLTQAHQGERYISPVYIDDTTSEPLVIMAIPVNDVLGDFQGTLTAEVNLKFMWDLVDQLKVGETGLAYVVDRQGTLLAFNDTARVLRGENLSNLGEVNKFMNGLSSAATSFSGLSTGIKGTMVIGSFAPLGTPDWAVVTEMPWQEAYRSIIQVTIVSLTIVVVMVGLSGLGGFFMARRLALPLSDLTQTASRIANGEIHLQATVDGAQEIIGLATAFNSMTSQLRQNLSGLEQRVAERTAELSQASDNLRHRVTQLQVSSEVSGVAVTLTDPKELIHQVVELIRERFDFYYVALFLVNDDNSYAILQYGTGDAGRELVKNGHRLAINNKSMIGWVCANKEARFSLNVDQDETHFANPLLPDTQSEMALPLRVGERVIGAFGVQSSQLSAFDENDVMVLQSMADQIAVALTNARLFDQTQQRAAELAVAKEEADKARQVAEAANTTLAAQMWHTVGQAQLNEQMRGEQDIPTMGRNVIQQLCEYLGFFTGALYLLDDQHLKLAGACAYQRKNLIEQFELGEGMVGEAALRQHKIILHMPENYMAILSSSLGEIPPRNVVFAPFSLNGELVGVIEMGALDEEFNATQMEFLDKALESVAIAFKTAQARKKVNELLVQTRQQAEELQAQEEELRATNEELEAQTESLRNSEAKLKENQAALEVANAELQEKAHALQEQQAKVDQQNRELERKAEELALASKYKSEFLANMSHELRTPLNSMLILAGMLAKNETGHLSPDEVESAQVIYSGGNDLLNLINEILDLAKVEAGKMEFHFAPMNWDYIVERMRAQFDPVSQRKGLQFIVSIAPDVPDPIVTDGQRLAQIVKNLLSNSFKFTEKGKVSLIIERVKSGSSFDPAQFVAVNVTDTGIGMTPEQQKVVFEAFTQADGTTSRQYGGTGLGLTITREMTRRLGGQVSLTSEPGKGSTFTIYLPIQGVGDGGQGVGETEQRQAPSVKPVSEAASQRGASSPLPLSPTPLPPTPSPSIPDDRDTITPSDHLLLIIEDDPAFVKIVLDYAHNKGFKAITTSDGESALLLLQSYMPHAVILDLGLPRMSGWEVLDQIKANPDTRHIPIHIISAENEDLTAFQRGAIGFLTKPVSQEGLDDAFQHIEQLITAKIKSLLLVEDDDALRMSVRKLLEGNDIEITETGLGKTALEKLAAQHFDCMILDLALPDMTGFELLNRIHNDASLIKCPVIIYTGKELSPEENLELLKYADSVIVKGVKSPDRLLDETALFLHRVIANLPEDKQRTIRKLHNPEGVLEGKQILLVDDDTRNAFALSKLLADKGVKMHIAPSGLKALEALEKLPHISLVLTDIMMPGMDGYELTKRIRQQPQFKQLPIIALTAKAMKGDREKCLEAGANDYLSKPIDPDRLFSVLRVWLSKE